MEFFVGLAIGAVGASVAWFLIARNNRKHIAKVLDLDASVGWETIRTKIKSLL